MASCTFLAKFKKNIAQKYLGGEARTKMALRLGITETQVTCVLESSSIIDIRSRPGSRTGELNGGKCILCWHEMGLDMRCDVGDAYKRRVLMCLTVNTKNYIFIQGDDSLRACYILAGGKRLRKGKGR